MFHYPLSESVSETPKRPRYTEHLGGECVLSERYRSGVPGCLASDGSVSAPEAAPDTPWSFLRRPVLFLHGRSWRRLLTERVYLATSAVRAIKTTTSAWRLRRSPRRARRVRLTCESWATSDLHFSVGCCAAVAERRAQIIRHSPSGSPL